MAGIDYNAVRNLVSMSTVLDLVGFEETAHDVNGLRGPCPIHHGSDGSRTFSVNVNRGIFRCFKCGAGGNALDLYCKVNGIGIFAGAARLCEEAGVDIPWVKTW